MKHTYPVIKDIGLVVHDTFETSFNAFEQEWHFNVRSQSEANIARGCLTYYKAMWDGHDISRDVIVDVGAHVGFFAIPIASQVAHVVAIEPAPANYDLLQRNISRNAVVNITPVHAAVSGTFGPVQLNLGVQGTTGHSVVSKKRGGMSVEVPGLTLAPIVATYDPTILKLDCEGAEWEILTDPGLLTRIHTIVAELHKVTGGKLELLEQVLSQAGYTYSIKSNSWFSKLIAHKEL